MSNGEPSNHLLNSLVTVEATIFPIHNDTDDHHVNHTLSVDSLHGQIRENTWCQRPLQSKLSSSSPLQVDISNLTDDRSEAQAAHPSVLSHRASQGAMFDCVVNDHTTDTKPRQHESYLILDQSSEHQYANNTPTQRINEVNPPDHHDYNYRGDFPPDSPGDFEHPISPISSGGDLLTNTSVITTSSTSTGTNNIAIVLELENHEGEPSGTILHATFDVASSKLKECLPPQVLLWFLQKFAFLAYPDYVDLLKSLGITISNKDEVMKQQKSKLSQVWEKKQSKEVKQVLGKRKQMQDTASGTYEPKSESKESTQGAALGTYELKGKKPTAKSHFNTFLEELWQRMIAAAENNHHFKYFHLVGTDADVAVRGPDGCVYTLDMFRRYFANHAQYNRTHPGSFMNTPQYSNYVAVFDSVLLYCIHLGIHPNYPSKWMYFANYKFPISEEDKRSDNAAINSGHVQMNSIRDNCHKHCCENGLKVPRKNLSCFWNTTIHLFTIGMIFGDLEPYYMNIHGRHGNCAEHKAKRRSRNGDDQSQPQQVPEDSERSVRARTESYNTNNQFTSSSSDNTAHSVSETSDDLPSLEIISSVEGGHSDREQVAASESDVAVASSTNAAYIVESSTAMSALTNAQPSADGSHSSSSSNSNSWLEPLQRSGSPSEVDHRWYQSPPGVDFDGFACEFDCEFDDLF